MTGYIFAWLSAMTLVVSTALLATNSGNTGYVASAFLIGFAVVHGCAIFADTMRNTEAPWVRKGIIVFWSGVLLSILLGVIL